MRRKGDREIYMCLFIHEKKKRERRKRNLGIIDQRLMRLFSKANGWKLGGKHEGTGIEVMTKGHFFDLLFNMF